MADDFRWSGVIGRGEARWGLLLGVALGLRVLAAVVVSWYAARVGKPCVFGDTAIYIELARKIVEGRVYEVSQWGVPHFALRTPGYPIFLAICRSVFGANLLWVRLVQAFLGVAAVWMVGRLTAMVQRGGDSSTMWSAAWVAVALAAVEPYVVGLSALVLSEAVFLPLMMAGLWGLAVLWRPSTDDRSGRPITVAGLTGLAMGGAILARPSWALFVPLILLAWVVGSPRLDRSKAVRGALIVAMATGLVLAPWWVRNARVVGRFVPTALWVGASLYDGVGPQADGSSDMRFVDAPDVRSLGEVEQDATFRRRSVEFARENPGRVATLALVKLGRFWSPWPNADTLRNPWAALVSAVVTLPVFALAAVGAWDRRRDFRTLALLAGPLVYFCGLHLVFVSSIRYRIPGLVPALGLAGIGWVRLGTWVQGRRKPDPAIETGSEAAPR